MGGYPRTNKKPMTIWSPWYGDVYVGGRTRAAISLRFQTVKKDIKEDIQGYIELSFGRQVFWIKRKTLLTQTKTGINKVPPSHLERTGEPRDGFGKNLEESTAWMRRKKRLAHKPNF